MPRHLPSAIKLQAQVSRGTRRCRRATADRGARRCSERARRFFDPLQRIHDKQPRRSAEELDRTCSRRCAADTALLCRDPGSPVLAVRTIDTPIPLNSAHIRNPLICERILDFVPAPAAIARQTMSDADHIVALSPPTTSAQGQLVVGDLNRRARTQRRRRTRGSRRHVDEDRRGRVSQ